MAHVERSADYPLQVIMVSGLARAPAVIGNAGVGSALLPAAAITAADRRFGNGDQLREIAELAMNDRTLGALQLPTFRSTIILPPDGQQNCL